MFAKNLLASEYDSYYQPYINKTNALSINKGLIKNHEMTLKFLDNLPKDKHEFQYEVGKWSIKEMLLHLIDTERIFAYRALRVARNDRTSLPGFDQDMYIAPSKANDRSFDSLLNEYKCVRQATISLFENFDNEMLMAIGVASNHSISVRAIGFIIMGHENHHCDVIRERYL